MLQSTLPHGERRLDRWRTIVSDKLQSTLPHGERLRAKDSLLKAVVELAEHKELKTLSTRDRVNAVIWGRFGFEVVTEPKKRRGEFVRWMRRMEDKP